MQVPKKETLHPNKEHLQAFQTPNHHLPPHNLQQQILRPPLINPPNPFGQQMDRFRVSRTLLYVPEETVPLQ